MGDDHLVSTVEHSSMDMACIWLFYKLTSYIYIYKCGWLLYVFFPLELLSHINLTSWFLLLDRENLIVRQYGAWRVTIQSTLSWAWKWFNWLRTFNHLHHLAIPDSKFELLASLFGFIHIKCDPSAACIQLIHQLVLIRFSISQGSISLSGSVPFSLALLSISDAHHDITLIRFVYTWKEVQTSLNVLSC